jgi:membrane protein
MLKQAGVDWVEDNALRLSAAMAYYSIFSIAPLLVIAIAIAGFALGPEASQGLLQQQLQGLVGAKSAAAVQDMVQSASKPSSSWTAGIVGVVTLLLGASGVVGQLKDALNTIWEVESKPGQGIMGFIRQRLLSFAFVLVIGFLLLVSLLLTTALSGASKFIGNALPMSEAILGVFTFVISFAVITLLFACIYKFLPDAKVEWRHVWIGAAVTSLLFEIGKWLLAMYLGRESTASPYGAAASVVLLLLWVYYASLILFYGAEFTQVYARAHGAAIEPAENAQRVAAAKPLKQPLTMNESNASTSPGSPGQNIPAKDSRDSNGAEIRGPRKESPRLAVGPAPVSADHQGNQFVEKNAVPILLGAVGGGLLLGALLRRGEVGAELSPGQQVKSGSRTMMLGLTAAAIAAYNRWSKIAKRELKPAKLRKTGESIVRKAQEGVEAAIAQVR